MFFFFVAEYEFKIENIKSSKSIGISIICMIEELEGCKYLVSTGIKSIQEKNPLMTQTIFAYKGL